MSSMTALSVTVTCKQGLVFIPISHPSKSRNQVLCSCSSWSCCHLLYCSKRKCVLLLVAAIAVATIAAAAAAAVVELPLALLRNPPSPTPPSSFVGIALKT